MNKKVSNAWMALALDILGLFAFGFPLTLVASIICCIGLTKKDENHILCGAVLAVSAIMCLVCLVFFVL